MATYPLSQISRDYFAVENVLQRRREQVESVKGKPTPFRVEFRYRGGSRSYQYFTDIIAAMAADDRQCRYGMTGRAIIERPLSQQVQVRGPRGGWSKWTEASNED